LVWLGRFPSTACSKGLLRYLSTNSTLSERFLAIGGTFRPDFYPNFRSFRLKDFSQDLFEHGRGQARGALSVEAFDFAV